MSWESARLYKIVRYFYLSGNHAVVSTSAGRHPVSQPSTIHIATLDGRFLGQLMATFVGSMPSWRLATLLTQLHRDQRAIAHRRRDTIRNHVTRYHVIRNHTIDNHVLRNHTIEYQAIRNQVIRNHVLRNHARQNHVIRNHAIQNHTIEYQAVLNIVIRNQTVRNHMTWNHAIRSHVIQNQAILWYYAIQNHMRCRDTLTELPHY